jgi:cytochrome c-type protein NapC
MAGMALAVTALIVLAIALIAVVALRPNLTAARGGKVLAFLAFFLLPVLGTVFALEAHLDRSKSTEFCLSCHVMEPYGKSLRIDNADFVPAAHFQNRRIPRDQACYTCHTNYAMFGGLKAKLGGLRHMYVYYLGTPPKPEEIKLYEPYNNRECLHCHAGARSFEEGVVHTADPAIMADIKSNKLSCVSSGCHDTVHDVAKLDQMSAAACPAQAAIEEPGGLQDLDEAVVRAVHVADRHDALDAVDLARWFGGSAAQWRGRRRDGCRDRSGEAETHRAARHFRFANLSNPFTMSSRRPRSASTAPASRTKSPISRLSVSRLSALIRSRNG